MYAADSPVNTVSESARAKVEASYSLEKAKQNERHAVLDYQKDQRGHQKFRTEGRVITCFMQTLNLIYDNNNNCLLVCMADLGGFCVSHAVVAQ
jgi:hypothetical protein